MTHYLKIEPAYFRAVLVGIKTFEIRIDDRQYCIGDTLVLQEYSSHLRCYFGRSLVVTITYKLHDCDGLSDGYCILGFDAPRKLGASITPNFCDK